MSTVIAMSQDMRDGMQSFAILCLALGLILTSISR
jgi:hypothetical protein